MEKPSIPNLNAHVFFPEGIEKLLGKDTFGKLTTIITRFDEIKTSKNLLSYYNDNHELVGEFLMPISSSIYYGVNDLGENNFSEEEFNCILKAFEFAQLCSECDMELYVNNEAFLAKAKGTPNQLDDEIFQLMSDAVGSYNSFNVSNLSEHDCDFCWHSVLGDGQILAYWKRVAKIMGSHQENQAAVDIDLIMRQMSMYLFDEMQSSTYVYPQEKVLEEYDEIIKVLNTIDWQEIKALPYEKGRNRIEVGKGLTFDCKNRDCATVVMKELFPEN